MSSNDSFVASGNSPTRKKKTKWDFRVEFHGAIILLCPLTKPGFRWIERHIGADNGYQPYYPTVILEPPLHGRRSLGHSQARTGGAMTYIIKAGSMTTEIKQVDKRPWGDNWRKPTPRELELFKWYWKNKYGYEPRPHELAGFDPDWTVLRAGYAGTGQEASLDAELRAEGWTMVD